MTLSDRVAAAPVLLAEVNRWLAGHDEDAPYRLQNITDAVVGLDARGFLFGVPVAQAFQVPFYMCRKAGKLPGPCDAVTYDLEYGSATVELQRGVVKGKGVVVIDDLLATGGTAYAAIKLIRGQGGTVNEAVFLTGLGFLDGRKRLEDAGITVRSLVTL